MNTDIADIRDIIEHFEKIETDLLNRFNEQQNLEDTIDNSENAVFKTWLSQIRNTDEQADEFFLTLSLLDELRGCGGDEQWRGDWYPVTLIRDNYFEEYARQLAEDIGAISNDASWPNNCIDWKQAAIELEADYSMVNFGDETFLYR